MIIWVLIPSFLPIQKAERCRSFLFTGGSQCLKHFHASAFQNPMELDFRLNPGELHCLQNIAIEIGTNVPFELFPGTPALEIQDGSFLANFLADPASRAVGLSLDRALDGT